MSRVELSYSFLCEFPDVLAEFVLDLLEFEVGLSVEVLRLYEAAQFGI